MTSNQRLAEYRNLSDEQRARLELRLRGKATPPLDDASAASTTIRRRSGQNHAPLSFAQQRLWFLEQFQSNTSFYNISMTLAVRGPLNLPAFDAAFGEAVRRHEVLRTDFQAANDEPFQIIRLPSFVTIGVVDLSSSPAGQQQRLVNQLALEESDLPFNLARAPLFRITILRLDGSNHIVLFSIHHVIFDLWSASILFRELWSLYERFARGDSSELEELPIQYADFAEWQRVTQQSVIQKQLEYWQSNLAGLPEVLELPIDRARPPLQTFNGRPLSFQFPLDIGVRAQNFARRTGTTPFMLFLTVLQTLLFRYTAQQDIAIGTPIANRNLLELENLIGFFVNTLVMRNGFGGDPKFVQLLDQVRTTCLNAYANQDVPFEKLVEHLQPNRNLSHSPLFQVMLAVQNAPPAETGLANLEVALKDSGRPSAKFDLSLFFSEKDQAHSCTAVYNTDLFDEETIERMLRHYAVLLEAAVAHPELRVSRLPIVSPAERKHILLDWNDSAKPYGDALLPELIEQHLSLAPDSVALVFDNDQLTSGQLNARTNQLARFLVNHGVAAEDRVGICLERSLEMIIAVLATLKAGAAYVPIDPSYPKDRQAFMLADCKAAVLLTMSGIDAPMAQCPVLSLDRDAVEIQREDATTLHVQVHGDQLAYIIYTSGSTGAPKGAMNTHRAVANRLLWMQDFFGLDRTDSVLQKTPFSFDVSVWELLWPLFTGARLIIASPGGHQDAAYLRDLISSECISTIHFVPSMLRLFLEVNSDLTSLNALRRVVASGESLTKDLETFFFSRSDSELHNLYGPTEAAVDVSYWHCRPDSLKSAVPIGRPIANVSLYILDHSFEPVPPSVKGELLIGGRAPGRGYFNRPDLTAEKFIPDPVSTNPGQRVYRTGDLASYSPSGDIIYLGRKDNQVKIRGFRIELGEIEAALRDHDTIKDAVVVVSNKAPDQRLVAYVTGPPPGQNNRDMRNHLASRLPEYMVPSVIVSLDSLPLLPNGKVDRRSLPQVDGSRSLSPGSYVGPRDLTELRLQQIWEQLLDIKPISVTDNFFDLGGHSFHAIRMTSQLRKALQRDLPLSTLFQEPTIERLATVFRAKSPALDTQLISIRPNAEGVPLFCIHASGGGVLCYQDLARCLPADIPFYAIGAPGIDRDLPRCTSIEEMAEEYIQVVMRERPSGPISVGGWSMGGVIAYEMAIQLRRIGREVTLVALVDSYVPKPGNGQHRPLDYEEDSAVGCVEAFRHIFGLDLCGEIYAIDQLDPDQRLPYIFDQAKARALLPPGYEIVEVARLIRTFRNNVRALYNYVPTNYSGRVLFLQASDAQPEQLCTMIDWKEVVNGPLETHVVAGDHFSIVRQPHVQAAAEELARVLKSETPQALPEKA